MQKAKAGSTVHVVPNRRRGAQIVPREYAGKWVAWSAGGREIVAVAASFNACEKAAALAGFDADQIAIERVPPSRQRVTGSGM
jgi:hypothetical protein